MSAKTQKKSGGGKNVATKPRIVYFDVFRAFLPILVVIIHTAVNFGHNSFYSRHFVGCLALKIVCQVAVPLFFMVSGALFLDPNKSFDFKRHMRKYVLRMAILYAVWSTFYALCGYFFADSGVSQDVRLKSFLAELFGLHHYHLWFIMGLLAMYLLVPCLRKITESRALTQYFLMLGIVFCFALPSLGEYFSLIMQRSSGTNPWVMGPLSGMADWISYFSAKLNLRFVVFFVLGWYLHTAKIDRKWRILLYFIGVAGLANEFMVGLFRTRLTGAYHGGAEMENINIGILAYGTAVFVFAKQAFRRAKKLPRIVLFMAKYSFGVYLIHVFFDDFMVYRVFTDGAVPLWLGLLFSVPVYAISLWASFVFSKIPLLRKVVQ